MVAFGFLGKINHAVIEATEITPDGRVYLTSSIGASPTFLKYADKVIIKINPVIPLLYTVYITINFTVEGVQ